MKRPCMSRATSRWCSRATASRCAVGRARPGAGDQTGQRGRPGLERRQNQGGFVEHADSARVVHTLIMPSHNMDCKSVGSPARSNLRRGTRASEPDSKHRSQERSWVGP